MLTDWRNIVQDRFPPTTHQEQAEGETFYLTHVSPLSRYWVYALHWNTNPRVPYGKRFSICKKFPEGEVSE